ncbi:hypothetical protein GGR58DRAFT_491254 [Xylaria digitata]|nr:hypothetical protein GGR58DRAFT_491254 [Xylaria digitata]
MQIPNRLEPSRSKIIATISYIHIYPYQRSPHTKGESHWNSNMPLDNNDNKGVTGAAKFVTSTLGNVAGGVGRTVGNVTGAAGRGVGDTITSTTGSAGKPVGDAISSVGTGIENGANSVSKGVENAGQWKS